MTEIILIAAVGKRGQLGLNGGLPWGTDFKEDRLRFRNETAGHIVIFGYKTWRSIMHLDGTYDRLFHFDVTEASPESHIESMRKHWPDRNIFIAGGAKTYARWIPYITRFDITQLPYDGPADVWMPPLFSQDPAPPDRKSWLRSDIAQVKIMMARKKDCDPIGFSQLAVRLETLQAELFAMTGDSDGHC